MNIKKINLAILFNLLFVLLQLSPSVYAADPIRLNISIPTTTKTFTQVDDLSQYTVAIFEFMIVALAITLTATMIFAGFLYIASAGIPSRIDFAKNLIKKTGLALLTLLFSVVIINQINPKLTSLSVPNVSQIDSIFCCKNEEKGLFLNNDACPKGDELVDIDQCVFSNESEEDLMGKPGLLLKIPRDHELQQLISLGKHEVFSGFIKVEYSNKIEIDLPTNNYHFYISSETNDPRLMPATLERLKRAFAFKSYNQRQQIVPLITGAFRTEDYQKSLIKKHCPPANGGKWSTPKKSTDCTPETALGFSVHMTGQAVDVWGATDLGNSPTQCITQDACKKNLSACVNNPCQKEIILQMLNNGFCMLETEPWHFELYDGSALSSNCKVKKDLISTYPSLGEVSPSTSPTTTVPFFEYSGDSTSPLP